MAEQYVEVWHEHSLKIEVSKSIFFCFFGNFFIFSSVNVAVVWQFFGAARARAPGSLV